MRVGKYVDVEDFEQKEKYLPKIATAEYKASYALTEPESGSDANSGKTKATFTEKGDHDVVLQVTDGVCIDTISFVLSVQGIIEYNAFSPNGDNINDYFSFENYGISDLNAIFYNRWGDKIYEMNSPFDSWNGVSMNGLEVPEGVYFYVLNATGEDGTSYNEKGSVTIYR